MAVEFVDNSIAVIGALNDAMIQFLHEAAGELQAQTVREFDNAHQGERLSHLDIQLKGSYDHKVDESKGYAEVGSPMEAAYWEEFGTGTYAEHGDGRKGWWVYVEDSGSGSGGKSYATQEEAEDAAKFLRSKGMKAHATNGRNPNKTLRKAFDSKKNAIINRAEQIMRENMGD